MDHLCKEQSI